MSKIVAEYLRHIQDEIEFVLNESKNLNKEDFLKNETLKRAFSRSLEIIGEATKNIPNEYRNKHNNIEWRAIAGLRDKLIHHYFGVDYEIVWDVVKNELPSLKRKINNLLQE